MGTADLHRSSGGEIRRERRRSSHRPVGGNHERQIEDISWLDAGSDAGRQEPLRGDDAHGKSATRGMPSVSGSPRAMFVDCSAWPEPPFVRLSSAESNNTVFVLSS